mmetsp:Transcript_64099/g.171539  ORF Transcript_64099/g.171539 Transcript_64099/m.171539 type:complete len:409 (+) Transcript_64099:1067-2293(+)
MHEILLHGPPRLARVTESRELLGHDAKPGRVILDPFLLPELLQPRLGHRCRPGVLGRTRVPKRVGCCLPLRFLHLLRDVNQLAANPLLLCVPAHLLLPCRVQVGPGGEHGVLVEAQARMLRLPLRIDKGVDRHEARSNSSSLVVCLRPLGDVLDGRVRHVMLLGHPGLGYIVRMARIPLLLRPVTGVGGFRLAVQPQFRDRLVAWSPLLEARVGLPDLVAIVDGEYLATPLHHRERPLTPGLVVAPVELVQPAVVQGLDRRGLLFIIEVAVVVPIEVLPYKIVPLADDAIPVHVKGYVGVLLSAAGRDELGSRADVYGLLPVVGDLLLHIPALVLEARADGLSAVNIIVRDVPITCTVVQSRIAGYSGNRRVHISIPRASCLAAAAQGAAPAAGYGGHPRSARLFTAG